MIGLFDAENGGSVQILKPAEKKAKYPYGNVNMGRPVTPPRKQKKKDANKMG